MAHSRSERNSSSSFDLCTNPTSCLSLFSLQPARSRLLSWSCSIHNNPKDSGPLSPIMKNMRPTCRYESSPCLNWVLVLLIYCPVVMRQIWCHASRIRQVRNGIPRVWESGAIKKFSSKYICAPIPGGLKLAVRLWKMTTHHNQIAE